MIRLALTCAVAVAAATALGCGKSKGPATVPVSGTVYLDGKPLAGVEVNFFSENANFLGSGMTDKNGHYELYQGAVPGENKVWITKASLNPLAPTADVEENPEKDEAQLEAMAAAQGGGTGEQEKKDDLPKKFSDPGATVLKYTVPDGGTDKADFRLTSQ